MQVFATLLLLLHRLLNALTQWIQRPAGALLVVGAVARAAAARQAPNVLFIVADDLGWNDVSWHNKYMYTPVLEELAASGVLLDQYYVQPTCSPSRVAFMTGKYPYRVGRQHMYIKPLMPAGLPANVPIMPQYFKRAGYMTHAVGKWHLGFCHQNYTPTYRGFDSFYGFYLGSQDYYLHTKDYHRNLGYDFRFNENILKGPEVEGKYSADLFVKRTKAIIENFKVQSQNGESPKPWFTYLSFQNVHEPMQVPNVYTKNVCRYKDLTRYYYTASVSALDHAVDQVVKSLKENGQYENTIIAFTTDNGGAANFGGNNYPLKGTKGTLYEGGTRGIAFVHSPLLNRKGYTSNNLMHGVDWLPTLISAAGYPGLAATSATDGVDLWPSISESLEGPRKEVVYNIKEKPFMGAIRVGDYKLIWGSRTSKNVWYKPNEEPRNALLCESVLKERTTEYLTFKSRLNYVETPRGMDTMDTHNLTVSEDTEYWDPEERMISEEDQYEDDEDDEDEEDEDEVLKRTRRGGKGRGRSGFARRRGSGQKKNKKKNKNKKGNRKKNKFFQNRNGVEIKPFGTVLLYNLKEDPEERHDISSENVLLVEALKKKIEGHFYDLQPRFTPDDSEAGDPRRWGGFWGPGWCEAKNI